MINLFGFKLETSDTFSILALLISGASAIYARWTWKESKKSNAISLLAQKKEIHDAFFELKMHMEQRAEFAELEEVSKFYRHQRNAKIYFSPSLAGDIENYFNACFNIANINKRDGGITSLNISEFKPYKNIEKQLSKKIDAEIIKLLKDI